MYRLSYQRIFDGKNLIELDLPRTIKEGLKTPFDVIKALNEFFPDCIKEKNDLIPTSSDLKKRRVETARGEHGCRCRVIVEYYEG